MAAMTPMKSKKGKGSSKKSKPAKKPAPVKKPTPPKRPTTPVAPPKKIVTTLTQAQSQKLTARAIFDNAFRYRLLRNPKAAAAELKITLTKDEVDYIKSLDAAEINSLASEIQAISHQIMGAVNWG